MAGRSKGGHLGSAILHFLILPAKFDQKVTKINKRTPK